MAVLPIGAAGAIGGGLLGALLGGDDSSNAQQITQDQLQRWLQLNVPDPAQQALALQQYQQTGRLDPQLQQAIAQDPSAMSDISQDPRLAQSQMDALGQLQNISSSGGMTMADKANLQSSLASGQQQYAGQLGAINQNMAQRGIGGSGLDLASKLSAAQGQAQNANAAGVQAAGDASTRALTALSSGASLAGNIQTNDFNRQAQQAQAQDAINKFNTTNQQGVNAANTTALNDAQKSNLNAQQSISNANTDLANQQQTANKALIQQQYNNDVTQLNGAGGATAAAAAQDQANAETKRKQGAGIGSALGNLF